MRVFASPQNQGPARIYNGRGRVSAASGVCQPGIDQLLGIAEVGGEEYVEGCAVLDLGGEGGGGSGFCG